MFGLLFFVSMGFPILSFVNSLSGNLSNRQSDELRLYYMVRPRSQNDGGQPSETVFVWLGFRQSGEERCPFKHRDNPQLPKGHCFQPTRSFSR